MNAEGQRGIWNEIRGHLQAEESRIGREIDSYPTPVAGCDQQFNYLLEQRATLSSESNRLKEAEAESLKSPDPREVLDRFVNSSRCLDGESRASLRARITKRGSGR